MHLHPDLYVSHLFRQVRRAKKEREARGEKAFNKKTWGQGGDETMKAPKMLFGKQK